MDDNKRYAREWKARKASDAWKEFLAMLERTACSRKAGKKMRNLAWRMLGQIEKVDLCYAIDVLDKKLTLTQLEKKAKIV